jgi:hypothetical protein
MRSRTCSRVPENGPRVSILIDARAVANFRESGTSWSSLRIRYAPSNLAYSRTLVFWRTTGLTGTFWKGPRDPVGVLEMASTTFMPSVTLPNTA